MVGSAALGLSRKLRTRPIRNRPRTSRWGQVEHKPVATSSTYVEPPQRAHSLRATSCRNKDGPYRDPGLGYLINNAREFLRTDVVVVGLVVYAVLGLVTDYLVRLLERRALRWRAK
jgi:hypothetical protein